MISPFDETCAESRDTSPTPLPASFAFAAAAQENVRLRLALREARHRSCNQWQFLIGLAELERLQNPQEDAGCGTRLRAVMQAYVALNRALDAETDILSGVQKVSVRPALESVLTQLQTTFEAGSLSFTAQDAPLSEQGCAALLLICAELVCNAAKYGRQSTQVAFRAEAGQGILEVHDDGPGFPAGFCIGEQARQGLQLVEALCHFDLKGAMRCHNTAQGGVVTLTFPVESPAPEAPAADGAEKANKANESLCAMEGIICFDALPG